MRESGSTDDLLHSFSLLVSGSGIPPAVSAETYIAGELGVSLPFPGTAVGDENINYPNAPAPGQLFRGSENDRGGSKTR